MTKVHAHRQQLGFRIHALVFVLTLFGLLAIDMGFGGKVWIRWVALGWTPSLVAHWIWGSGRSAPAA